MIIPPGTLDFWHLVYIMDKLTKNTVTNLPALSEALVEIEGKMGTGVVINAVDKKLTNRYKNVNVMNSRNSCKNIFH